MSAAIGVSVLYREPMWLKRNTRFPGALGGVVSVLYREPMWLKLPTMHLHPPRTIVSVLYREPMWLKHKVLKLISDTEKQFQCSTVSRCG